MVVISDHDLHGAQREPTQTQQEHANSTRPSAQESNPQLPCCEATALTTAPPCRPHVFEVMLEHSSSC